MLGITLLGLSYKQWGFNVQKWLLSSSLVFGQYVCEDVEDSLWPGYLWFPGLWWLWHMGFFLPQRQIVCIRDFCYGIFSLVCVVVNLAWQRAWKSYI